jgi:BASS family bile acid:Na+ symporter
VPGPVSSLLTALDALGRHGTRAVAAVVVLGFALPAVGAALRPWLTPAVFILLVLAFMRLDLAACRAYLRRPGLVLAAAAWTAIGVPVLCGVLGWGAGIARRDPDVYVALVLQGVASPMMATPAFAALLGLDASLVLVTLVTSSILLPITAPLFAQVFLGPSLPIPAGALAERLFLLLGAGAVVGLALRRLVGAGRIDWHRTRIDGLNVLVVFVFVIALTGTAGPRILESPGEALRSFFLASLVFLAVFAATQAVFVRAGANRALALAIMTAQRNLGLMLAGTGGVLPGAAWLYFALAQLPIYLSPELVRLQMRRVPIPPPPLDPDLMTRLVGKRLLIGLTVLDREGRHVETQEIHGRVLEVTPERGIVLQRPDASLFRLPPDLRGIRPARPGLYRLNATGEEVRDPDYLCEWVVTKE